ncbi:hypothetical protein AQUCO_05300108v1 [Aquilegia coerulea]|uniref:Glycolipid transfer protein domain-containing protein n=1 Tax=Aquilegia coerulea TaxID=218851 RepID=A0A2G5CIG6_AQUCA|nr:hypothetical protein AQUCO_05300108v1 [Aquilegia coerulea]
MADGEEKPLRKVAEAFEELQTIVNSQPQELGLALLCNACSLILPFFVGLGIALKFAEMDYVSKVEDLCEASKTIISVQSMIDQDIQHNTVKKCGSNSRNLLRVKRALDMMKVLFEQILATEGNSLKCSASTAYTQVFAAHHGFAIRKAATAGMLLLPTKSRFLTMLNEDELYMQRYVIASAPVLEYIDNLFHSRELGVDW